MAESEASAAAAAAAAVDETDALHRALHERLLMTGEWDRILATLSRMLEDSGWEGEFRKYAAAAAKEQQPLKLTTLMEAIGPHARESLPANIRAHISTMLREFLDRNLEAA